MGITGDVEFVCLDGPSIVVRLTGRFWHEKSAVRMNQSHDIIKYPINNTKRDKIPLMWKLIT